MEITNPDLEGDVAALEERTEARYVAIGHNFRYDRRPDGPRAEGYNKYYKPADDDGPPGDALHARHMRYIKNHVNVPLGEESETFSQRNTGALLSLNPDQRILRLEDLRNPSESLATEITNLYEAMGLPKGRLSGHEPVADEIVNWLNNRPSGGGRPRFAAFFDEVAEDLDQPDWPHRLRNRLGLAHLDPAYRDTTIPVALMVYTVREIRDAAPSGGRERLAAVPSVLDGPPNPWFFPAPTQQAYGRTVSLAHDPDCDGLVSEIVHRPLTYRPDHVYAVGVISSPPPAHEHPIRDRRNDHRVCVSVEAGLETELFGAAIGEAAHG